MEGVDRCRTTVARAEPGSLCERFSTLVALRAHQSTRRRHSGRGRSDSDRRSSKDASSRDGPVKRYSQQGTPWTEATLLVGLYDSRQKLEREAPAFIRVKAFNELADVLNEFEKKDRVHVAGLLMIEVWQGRDGNVRESYELHADAIDRRPFPKLGKLIADQDTAPTHDERGGATTTAAWTRAPSTGPRRRRRITRSRRPRTTSVNSGAPRRPTTTSTRTIFGSETTENGRKPQRVAVDAKHRRRRTGRLGPQDARASATHATPAAAQSPPSEPPGNTAGGADAPAGQRQSTRETRAEATSAARSIREHQDGRAGPIRTEASQAAPDGELVFGNVACLKRAMTAARNILRTHVPSSRADAACRLISREG